MPTRGYGRLYCVFALEDLYLPGFSSVLVLVFLILHTGHRAVSPATTTHRNKQQLQLLTSLSRMFTEDIHTDIIINTTGGSISAHRAVLATRSPVFQNMFSDNLKEKELSAVNIPGMSFEACQAFLNYIYGNVQAEEFRIHMLALLQAADKYDVANLKEACDQSLMEGIDSKNVLETLQNAYLYQLPKQKSSCIR